MTSPPDWFLTVRVLYNLARFLPELKDASAPLLALPSALQKWAAPGLHEIEIVFRQSQFRATFPRENGPFPLILFSGGAADEADTYDALIQFWASHGFVIVQPVHADAYSRHRPFARGNLATWRRVVWDVWGLVLGDESPWRARVCDMTRLLDDLPEVADKIQSENIGAGGYSYGGHVAALLGGAKLWTGKKLVPMRDSRIKAAFSLTGQAPAKIAPGRVWNELQVPFLTISGEWDRDVRGRDWKGKMEGFSRLPKGEKYFFALKNANHFALSGRLLEVARETEHFAAQETISKTVRALSLLFWRAHLCGDKTAKEELKNGDFSPVVAQSFRK